RDPNHGKVVLYQLSYARMMSPGESPRGTCHYSKLTRGWQDPFSRAPVPIPPSVGGGFHPVPAVPTGGRSPALGGEPPLRPARRAPPAPPARPTRPGLPRPTGPPGRPRRPPGSPGPAGGGTPPAAAGPRAPGRRRRPAAR